MNDEDKYRLQGNQDFLVQNLKVNDIQDYLVGEFIITDEDSEQLSNIARHESTYQAARKLLVIIRKSPEPNCYKVFCDALNEKGYAYIVDTLRKTDVGKIRARFLREKQKHDEQVEKLNKQVWVQNELMMQLKQELDGVKEKVSAYDELEGKLREHGMTSKSFVEMMARYMEKGGFSKPDPAMEEGSLESQQDQLYDEMISQPKEQPTRAEQSDFKDPHGAASGSKEPVFDPHLVAEGDFGYLKKHSPEATSLARIVGKDIAFYLVAKKEQLTIHEPPNECAAAMRKMVDDLLEIHGEMFEKALREVDLDKFEGFQAIVNVFDELFRDDEVNWGRIVALYAYGGYFAVHSGFSLKDKHSWQRISTVGDFLGHYVDEKLDRWIREQGGWDNFITWLSRSPTNPQFSWGSLIGSVGVLGAVSAGVVLGIAALKS